MSSTIKTIASNNSWKLKYQKRKVALSNSSKSYPTLQLPSMFSFSNYYKTNSSLSISYSNKTSFLNLSTSIYINWRHLLLKSYRLKSSKSFLNKRGILAKLQAFEKSEASSISQLFSNYLHAKKRRFRGDYLWKH